MPSTIIGVPREIKDHEYRVGVTPAGVRALRAAGHYVKVQAEGPARAWNLGPRKGNLNIGADADVTIVDMKKEHVIDKTKLHSKSKVSPFHGWRVKGMPVYTIVRGNVQMKDGEVVGKPIGELQRPIV